jgi:hypothetical protein
MVPFQFCTPNIMWPARKRMFSKYEWKWKSTILLKSVNIYGWSYSRVLKSLAFTDRFSCFIGTFTLYKLWSQTWKFYIFYKGTSTLLDTCPDLLKECQDIEQENPDESCNKDTGETQKVLRKWSRGLFHHVRGGGHIDKWNPIYV